MDGNKWWAWKDSNLRPADYESEGLVDLCSVSERVVRGLSMYISPASKIRDYPEKRYACRTEPERVPKSGASVLMLSDSDEIGV